VIARLLREMEEVVFNTRELAAKSRGMIRVAALPSLCATLLPAAIARFRELHPGVSVVLSDVVAERVASLVKAEEVDFGVSSPSPGDSELRFTTLFSDRMVMACAPAKIATFCDSKRPGHIWFCQNRSN
jgi:DNA-binding transcriptional LysR family regulator